MTHPDLPYAVTGEHYPSRRSMVACTRGMVATSDPHGAQLASGLVPARQYLLSSSTVRHIA